MDALIAEYGEEDVMRWCETGRLVEELPRPEGVDMFALARGKGRWFVGTVNSVSLGTAEVFTTALTALREALE